MNNLTLRPALGQRAGIGTFYDARRASFSSDGVLNEGLPPNAIQTKVVQQSFTLVEQHASFEKKLEAMKISPWLAGSILTGLVDCKGYSRYLTEKQDRRAVHRALYHEILTVRYRLNFTSAGLKDCVSSSRVDAGAVTHIVAGIDWGARSTISARQPLADKEDESKAAAHFDADFATFAAAVEASQPAFLEEYRQAKPLQEITAFSDILDEEGVIIHDFREAFEFLQVIPLHVKDENGGKGYPIMYYLLPVDMLPMFLPVEVHGNGTYCPPPTDCLTSFVQLLEEFQTSRQRLGEYRSQISAKSQYLPPTHIQDIGRLPHMWKRAEEDLIANVRHALQTTQGGASNPDVLRGMLRDTRGSNFPWTKPSGHQWLADLIAWMVANGATYFGYNGLDLAKELAYYNRSEAYILSFNRACMKDEESWRPTLALWTGLLRNRKKKILMAVVDCDATLTPLQKSLISHHQMGQEVTDDLLEHRRFLADKCFARCDFPTVQIKDIQKPVKRRFVRIACPNSRCSSDKTCDWLCPRCMGHLEYGFTDQYIYCDCGRSLYTNFEFKCNGQRHGPEFSRYDKATLKSLLSSLRQYNYFNLLILGETGVGKSTFINALVNYLNFATLDEAIDTPDLNWLIPCSFAIQQMDRSNPDRAITEHAIKVGSRDDEQDGSKGDAATQQTTVYPVTFSTSTDLYTIRLIDTPGIGDTRGTEYDKKNMADILSTISGYDTLHGILILLKSNAARLTVVFRYCVQELLTHLHHTAAQNMIFGFTNTRISNYTPGDTFGPLKSLLNQHPHMGLGLSTPTTYCFDSESFRYLAACKNGLTLENKEDFDRSWKHSRQETMRLIDHIQSLKPHLVKSTISLNGARQLITQLTKPMAEMSQLIRTNISICEDQVQDLKDSRLTGDKLRTRLHIKKVQMNSTPLDRPRTVCANGSCTEVRDDGKGQNNKVILYNSHCHPTCYLTNVQADRMADPGLMSCAAMNGTNHCTHCSHHWQEHLHVYYELTPETVTVKDDGIQQKLKAHADDITVKQTAIKQLEKRIQEYEDEHNIIRQAAAKFGLFLKKYSITPYNDATIEYLDHLIKEEHAKVQAGGSDKKLLGLTEDREKHKETIVVLTRHLNTKANWSDLTEAGIEKEVTRLYGLKHFGENLKKLKQGISLAHESTYREMPYTVRRGPARHVRPMVSITPLSNSASLASSLVKIGKRGLGLS